MKTLNRGLLFFFCVFIFFSCGGKKEEDPRMLLIGSWRISHMNIHTILTMRNNGSWQSEDRMEGQHTRIIEKRGKSTGRWQMESKDRLVFSVESSEEAGLWSQGSLQTFILETLEPRKLVLRHPETGRTSEWTKVRADRPAEGEILAHQAVRMEPLIVNVARTRILERQRFLCLDLEFILGLEHPVENPEEIPPPPPLHPEVRETLLFYFSSLEYRDLNSFERVKEVRLHLRKMLNPYFDNRLEEIEVRNIIVAASSESLEEFILQYPQLRHEFGLTIPQRQAPEKPVPEN
ncbi:flagellar basal body-associated FliL family protein [Desulfobotulus sp. H1]|uniref:Flagellar protein FliL n=1 Tax=Desulfobotulus pelophilus TaxID=2823377 RepID=A0ABT3N6I0_9BACT|nr:flagellar basal body-associated FliL family protein [Desulfobotulus pelophilus]MCW7753070.1 flagellar basal body-associated FliL family protein [Desulfobotulus pelophilus]